MWTENRALTKRFSTTFEIIHNTASKLLNKICSYVNEFLFIKSDFLLLKYFNQGRGVVFLKGTVRFFLNLFFYYWRYGYETSYSYRKLNSKLFSYESVFSIRLIENEKLTENRFPNPDSNQTLLLQF